ncbi:unnamed protein product [Closterium sp. Yama58-4]|nr:unnamed protein product [Closterium sp. Yama58-4]
MLRALVLSDRQAISRHVSSLFCLASTLSADRLACPVPSVKLTSICASLSPRRFSVRNTWNRIAEHRHQDHALQIVSPSAPQLLIMSPAFPCRSPGFCCK